MDDLAPFEPPIEEEIAVQERGLTRREVAGMGRAAALKRQRREMRRELERQLHDPRRQREVEEAMAAMRAECYYIVARLVDDALRDLYGFGDKRLAKLWAYVKTRSIWDGYFERGLPLEEVTASTR